MLRQATRPRSTYASTYDECGRREHRRARGVRRHDDARERFLLAGDRRGVGRLSRRLGSLSSGLQEDALDLLGFDCLGTVSDRLEQGAEARLRTRRSTPSEARMTSASASAVKTACGGPARSSSARMNAATSSGASFGRRTEYVTRLRRSSFGVGPSFVRSSDCAISTMVVVLREILEEQAQSKQVAYVDEVRVVE